MENHRALRILGLYVKLVQSLRLILGTYSVKNVRPGTQSAYTPKQSLEIVSIQAKRPSRRHRSVQTLYNMTLCVGLLNVVLSVRRETVRSIQHKVSIPLDRDLYRLLYKPEMIQVREDVRRG